MNKFHNVQDIEKIDNLLIEIIKDYYITPNNRNVAPPLVKKNYKKLFTETTPPENGKDISELFSEFKENIYKYSVKTWHPLFLNQMSAGISYPSVVGDSLTSILNPTLSTWEASPVATIIERNVASWMAQMIGMPDTTSGIFLPGGSIANLLALTVARNSKLGNNIIFEGFNNNKKNIIISSDTTHYSIKNAANILGIGINNIKEISTDNRNEINIDECLSQIKYYKQNDYNIIAVVLVLGNTVTGGTDKIREIADLCKEHNIHLHIDAAFGGTLSLTDNKHLLDGIELADSVCWDAHKWFFSSLTSTVLLFPNQEKLKEALNSDADYLFHKHIHEDDEIEDLGRYTILCGKRFDALKVWFIWKLYGTKNLAEIAQSRLDLVRSFYEILKNDKDFIPSYEPVSPLMCFRFIPDSIKNKEASYIDKVQKDIRQYFRLSGEALFNIASLKNNYHFRMVLINPLTTLEDLTVLLEKIRTKGNEIINT